MGLNYFILCWCHTTDLKMSEKPYKIFAVKNWEETCNFCKLNFKSNSFYQLVVLTILAQWEDTKTKITYKNYILQQNYI